MPIWHKCGSDGHAYRHVVALILLLGAQVIAELERKPDELTEEKLSGIET
jgi:hypothetical protein